MTMLSVGVDVGTTRTKAIALDSSGQTRAVEAITTPWSMERGRRVLLPQALRAEVDLLLARLLDRLGGEQIASIGFTSIAESGFLCDVDGVALASALPWSDPYGERAAIEFGSEHGADAFSEVTGLRLSSTASVFKLRELGRKGGWNRPVRWLNVAEWLAVQFGARPRSERSLASRTGLLDVTRDRVDEHLRAWTNLPLVDTELVWAGDAVGEVRAEGRLAGAAIVIGGHDHLCAVVGAEATDPGDVLNSFGTAEAYIASVALATSAEEVNRRRRAGLETGYHVLRGAHSLIVGGAHGTYLSSAMDQLKTSMQTIEESHRVSDRAELDFLPDGDARSWLAAVLTTHERSMEMAAVIRAHARVERVVGTGGWLQSSWISGLKLRDLPQFEVSLREETAARGAAILAAESVGNRVLAAVGAS